MSLWQTPALKSRAMNASKRKFNALLSSFGNKSTTSLPSKSGINNGSSVDLAESGLKRRRVGRPISALSETTSHTQVPSISPPKRTNMAHHKSLSLASVEPNLTESPKYAPWDRVAFLRRLESFKSVTDWTPKPAKVNEVEWAKRGWVCRGQERVRCELCNVEILVKLNIKEFNGAEAKVLNAFDIEEALVEKYKQMIVTSHAETCLWKQRGCDDTIFKLPLNHTPTTIRALRERYDALCIINDRLPYMHNLHIPDGFDLDSIITYLPKEFFVPSSHCAQQSGCAIQPKLNRVAFIMALFGWTARPETNIRDGAAVCEACFRTLGLWLFKSKELDEAGEIIRPATMNHLDPIDQHREYCPWKLTSSQTGIVNASKLMKAPDLAAWQIIIRVLKNDSRLREAGRSYEKENDQAWVGDTKSRPGTALEKEYDDTDTELMREEKDKQRWARLRRVRSLFDTKAAKKLQKHSGSIEHGLS